MRWKYSYVKYYRCPRKNGLLVPEESCEVCEHANECTVYPSDYVERKVKYRRKRR